MHVQVTAPLRPTEDPDQVQAAVTAFFPEAATEVEDAQISAEAFSVDALRRRVWEQRIIDTFRGALLAGVDGAGVEVRINKQAAAQGRVSLPARPHPLGEVTIRMTVEDADPWDDAEALVWWLCPETRDGEIVGPTE